jgi:small subunit ribosomal protein S8
MTTTDPIADFLTRIRNAGKAKHRRVDIPASRLKKSLGQLLLDKKYIADMTLLEDKKQGVLRITLKYHQGKPVISGMRRVSRPGIRRYVNAGELPRVLNGLGIAIISTPRGLMTDAQARKEHVGGEVLAEVW